MSLSQAVTELQNSSAEQTLASQNLANEVANKMGQIDLAVKSATADIPNKIRDYFDAIIYVKSDGEDLTYPRNGWNYKTIKGAIEVFPSGAYIKVVLMEGNHDIDSNITVANKFIVLQGAGKTRTTVTFKKQVLGDTNQYVLYGFDLLRSYVHTIGLTYTSDLLQTDPIHSGHPHYCPMKLNFDSSFSFGCCQNQAIDGVFVLFAVIYPNTGTFGKFAANSLEVKGLLKKGLIGTYSGAHISVLPTGLAMSALDENGATAPVITGDIHRDTNGKALNVFGIEV
ncbi:hypothetical protein [Pseudoalteromonas rubra]|uniref:hypothetical protein n=1 Tax=Pseudoalteromonas rubra TaxID=43658 RepID=UPI002DB6F136|nr:hypothetical protein [Pseudoalteromonas rubra]MEC4090135.1 hypothetical protein [Pseudoalteromonas rubra]